MRWTLLAQVMTFAGMVIPIWIGRLDALSLLVFSSAISLIAYHCLSFSFTSLYARTENGSDSVVAIAASHWLIAIAVLLMISASAVLWMLDRHAVSQVVLCVCAMLTATACYNLAAARLIRSSDTSGFNRLRIAYGLTSCLSAIAFSLWWAGREALVAANVVALFGAAVLALNPTDLRTLARVSVPRARDVIAYNRRHSVAALGSLVSGVAFHAGSLALGGLGALAGTWSIVARVSGGFATVGQQVAGPPLEMKFAAALREDRPDVAFSLQSKGLASGFVLGLMSFAVTVAFLATAPADDLGGPGLYHMIPAAAVYTIAVGCTSVVTRNLMMIGRQKTFLFIAMGKIAVLSVALASLNGIGLIYAIAAIELVAQSIYILSCLQGLGDNRATCSMMRRFG